ncbi:MAG TPA: SDR family oxidoreductase [Bryobacteraceae bacterium]|nr:SDR family oxidoreductase [Bryobacteraceae bacterium]
MPLVTALVTGASSGLGAGFAKLCAAGGYDVVLLARRAPRLHQLAADLAKTYGIKARPLVADLADSAAPAAIFEQLNGTPIDILINNAGFGMRGPFAESDWARGAGLIEVNMVALAHLTRLFLPQMIHRRGGRILNVASTAAFVPGPFMALYYASKAFVLSFSEALANEVRGTGVTVTVLCPGATATEFAQAAGVEGSDLFHGPVMGAAEVARIGYDAMMAGQPSVIAGARNRWLIRGTRLVPRNFVAAQTRKLNWGK